MNEKLAYIAGVLDSDGYIGLVRHVDARRQNKPEYFRSTVRVSQTRKEAIILIQKVLGGKIYEHEPKSGNRRKQYDLVIYGIRESNEALKKVLPYLRIKRLQAEKVIEYTDIRIRKLSLKRSSRNTYQTEERVLWKEVLSLNKRGVYAL